MVSITVNLPSMESLSTDDIYDLLINPLMCKIIEVCESAGIPMLAAFQLSDEIGCTTVIDPDGKFIGDYAEVSRILLQNAKEGAIESGEGSDDVSAPAGA